jgi:hypothetical protein
MSNEALPRIPQRIPEVDREAQLLEIRRKAESRGRVEGIGIRPPGAPFPQASPQTGYYGIHLLKEPQWKPTIPLYFFVGGAAGSAAVIGAVCDWQDRDPEMAQHARWLAMGGAMASTALLIEDLGRPSRFLNMLRVFHEDSRALNLLGIGSALWETWEGFHLETRQEAALKPLKRGVSGWITRTGGVMSGPLPLCLRVLGGGSQRIRRWAAISGILGSLLTRYGWVRAGRSSAQDWRLPLQIPEEQSAADKEPEAFGQELKSAA